MNTLKNIWWRIAGEAMAVLAGFECWLMSRPARRCPVCDEWQPRDHTHAERDPDETRRDLLLCMCLDPDFGRDMLRCLRGVPEFVEFVRQNINLPDPPRGDDPLALFRRKLLSERGRGPVAR